MSREEEFKDAARLVVREQSGSSALIQRRMGLGYAKANLFLKQMEVLGIVGTRQEDGNREVLVSTLEELEEKLTS